ncbi:unnamed protein product [Prorocentrum cordatum]|uniref:Uncharacterized protein n=1 Tax=Prorocentrum cordatum TaxID=2364126 RepID=A0ABN9XA93_9DINO|nr:unnamed protein product [Polarella glacialis]
MLRVSSAFSNSVISRLSTTGSAATPFRPSCASSASEVAATASTAFSPPLHLRGGALERVAHLAIARGELQRPGGEARQGGGAVRGGRDGEFHTRAILRLVVALALPDLLLHDGLVCKGHVGGVVDLLQHEGHRGAVQRLVPEGGRLPRPFSSP